MPSGATGRRGLKPRLRLNRRAMACPSPCSAFSLLTVGRWPVPRHAEMTKKLAVTPILYLSHCGSSIGGGERQLYYLVTNLDRERYQPLVVCPDDGVFVEQLRSADIPTTILGLPPWRKAKSRLTRHSAAAKLVAFAKAHNVQLAHTSDSWLNPYLWHLKKQLNIPVISHVRNLLTLTQVRKYAFDRMDGIVAISEQSKAPLIQAGIPIEKIEVVLNCVDLSVFRPPSEDIETGRVLLQETRPFVIGIVGRIEPFKRQKTFVEIAARVAARCENVRFHIIGEALEILAHRTYKCEVRQLVSTLHLNERLIFTGHRADMPAAMQALALLVTLSAGSVIAEAMAAGKPVIGTPIGSTAEMIVDGVTGWVIPLEIPETKGVEAIADKIIHLVENRSLCERMGSASRKRAEGVFGIETHVKKVQEIYAALLRGGSTTSA